MVRKKPTPKKVAQTFTCVECRENYEHGLRPCEGCRRCGGCLADVGLTREGPDGPTEFCPICEQCFECCSKDGCEGADEYPLADD